MNETGDEKPESSDSSEDPAEVKPAEGMQEAADESDSEAAEPPTAHEAETEDVASEAKNDVRFEMALETLKTVTGAVGEAVSPIAKHIYDSRDHVKIGFGWMAAVAQRTFGKKSEE